MVGERPCKVGPYLEDLSSGEEHGVDDVMNSAPVSSRRLSTRMQHLHT